MSLLVSVLNRARGFRAPRRAKLTAALEAAARPFRRGGEVDVVWVACAEMRRLNRRFTGRGTETDVLAFADEGEALGEIVCNLELARKRAERFGHTREAEAILYAVHGLLHLLGEDDHTPEGRRRMRRMELEALAKAGLRIGGGEWDSGGRKG